MKPYFTVGEAQIYLGDCRDILPTLNRYSVDLIVTDPPYGISWKSSGKQLQIKTLVGDDDSSFVVGALSLALEKLRDKRHIYAFGRWEFSAISKIGGKCELIWDKEVPNGRGIKPWAGQHEYISFGVKVESPSDRKAGHGNGVARLRRGTVLSIPRISPTLLRWRGALHPTEKPVPIWRELIESSSRIGEVILDPFMGSGSSLEAAFLECRQAIGIEIDESHCEIAAKRLESLCQQEPTKEKL